MITLKRSRCLRRERKLMENINILICDDESDIVSALEIYLASEGYSVRKVYNGAQAVECVKAHGDVSLVIMDVMMPVMDGIQAASRIRETSNVPIIFLSAKSEDTDKILGLNIGGDDYITKPFNPVEVVARVRSQLRRYNDAPGHAEEGRNPEHRRHRSLTTARNACASTGTNDAHSRQKYDILSIL